MTKDDFKYKLKFKIHSASTRRKYLKYMLNYNIMDRVSTIIVILGQVYLIVFLFLDMTYFN